MNFRINGRVLAVVLVTLLMAATLVGGVLASGTGPGTPENASGVSRWSTSITLYPSTVITTDAVSYSASPRTISGLDVSQTGGYATADVFVTTDLSGTAAITLTPQFSTDRTNWADASFTWVSDTINTGSYALVFTADGTKYQQIPLAGLYLRYSINVVGLGTNEDVTATIKLVYKDY